MLLVPGLRIRSSGADSALRLRRGHWGRNGGQAHHRHAAAPREGTAPVALRGYPADFVCPTGLLANRLETLPLAPKRRKDAARVDGDGLASQQNLFGPLGRSPLTYPCGGDYDLLPMIARSIATLCGPCESGSHAEFDPHYGWGLLA